jgi:hypothetical protein
MAGRITKQEQKNRVWFKAEVGKRLEALGAAKRGEEKCYPYLLATSIGPLEVSPEEDWVACVWTDLERADQAIRDTRLNCYCGKWNHHYDAAMFKSRRMAQAAVDDFFCELGLFLPTGSKQP